MNNARLETADFLATKKDYLIVTGIGMGFGLLALPILQNIRPDFWVLNFTNAAGLIVVFTIFANTALWVGDLVGRKIFAVWQFVKFAAVGSLNAALDIGILNLLSFIFQIYSGPILAVFNIISVSIALINSYLLNKFWSFKSRAPIQPAEFIKFAGISLATIAINTGLVYFLTTLIGAPEIFSEPVWENISKLIAVPLTLIVNFLGYKFIVFKT